MNSKLKTIFLSIVFCYSLSAQQNLEPTSTQSIFDNSMAVKSTNAHDITMFPSINGYIKQAIFLENLPLEKNYKVEFYATKKAEVDNCNKHYLLGDFEMKTMDGWGYFYYVFKSNSELISTKMGCMDAAKMITDVPSGKTELIRYTSIMPLIVYAPEGIDIKYRIWKVDPKENKAIAY